MMMEAYAFPVDAGYYVGNDGAGGAGGALGARRRVILKRHFLFGNIHGLPSPGLPDPHR